MRRNWLVFKRLECGHTQISLAKKIGVSNETISRIERGDKKPSLKTAFKIANELGFDVKLFNKENESA